MLFVELALRLNVSEVFEEAGFAALRHRVKFECGH